MDAIIQQVAKQVARRYKRRAWWASTPDMEQEAMLAILDSAHRYDPRVGVPFAGYAQRIAQRAIQRALLKDSAPVSAGDSDRHALRGLQRAALDDEHTAVERWLRTEYEPRDPEQQLLWVEAQTALRQAVTDAIACGEDAALAKSVLLCKKKSRAVAAENSVSVQRVYSATYAARQRVETSFTCWRAWNAHVMGRPG